MRSRSPFWNVASFLRCEMCSLIAARITSETGWLSTEATVSRSSAWSAERRIVMAFAGFMPKQFATEVP